MRKRQKQPFIYAILKKFVYEKLFTIKVIKFMKIKKLCDSNDTFFYLAENLN